MEHKYYLSAKVTNKFWKMYSKVNKLLDIDDSDIADELGVATSMVYYMNVDNKQHPLERGYAYQLCTAMKCIILRMQKTSTSRKIIDADMALEYFINDYFVKEPAE